ncbi:N-acetyl-gamma-glutamyl-phosphate reductase [Halothermothrix orenii]|uniref:N-acetyl-gamma-glutamyl-phosphate reductase n=1 Tax=Halothermothrix orenii (strain H 168 / OCM 544 / DSM 9562) TaxID=373903 RepID=ARGC_HALOH|nr:N-acetyl-gamma-glutamyl-phosphate reductase [Halothermothrix orenii]B8D1G6.1 RecName: Full=N-acetyl-gamma-glutamyl-phosphate reductase; Short=AGPR; AltName: Full=N-acetyl-glutamate semialdehyde dehydrogenase; Short=NAGSA dehydrogenase [Halothermothrix orenii H 168]ACL69043.1 N-acetyl-gamma-glutamyl-phosphate reductase [Halothermothrix orenii H 168]
MIRVSIIGATGYTGIELVRLLANHPEVELSSLVSRNASNKPLSDIYPQFIGRIDLKFSEYDCQAICQNSDIVFTALPHGISQEIVGELYNCGVKIIDLSGDFRYKDSAIYEKWYRENHHYPHLLEKAVYGLVEINRNSIKRSSLVANPGCYPTASLLGLWPVISENLINLNTIIIDAKSGVSGAGKGLKRGSHFVEVDENIKGYSIGSHRHTSEIEEIIKTFSGNQKAIVSFTPHLVPMKRGILATIYVKLKQSISERALRELYHKYYPDHGFIKVLPRDIFPETKYVVGTNYCYIGLKYDTRTERLVIISAIDNLVKGAAGQAIQNMNVMFNLPEYMGLKQVGVFP